MNKKVWNHNYAYHKWIIQKINNNSTILDVGCGDGTLCFKLSSCNKVIGIDTSEDSIKIANQKNNYNNVSFVNADYLKYNFKDKYDVIIFVAAIHHMNMEEALIKAKSLLNKNGKILIVGLAKPSTIIDNIIELFRVIPSFLISKIKRNKSSEKLNIQTNYVFPTMNEVRLTIRKVLRNNYKLRQALHYRYLLTWKKN